MNDVQSRPKVFLITTLLALVTVALFWPVRNHEFVSFDDPLYLTENPHIRTGLTLENIRWAFSDHPTGFWRPLAQIALMLGCQLFGLNAGAHHLISLLVHLINTLLLFRVLNRMTGGLWQSAFVAALFAWHPLHVESVAWAVDLENLLGGLFWLLTLWTYVRYVQTKAESKKQKIESGPPPSALRHPPFRHLPSSIFYLLALACFALGLMCKPIVTLPFVLLLLDYWPLRRFEFGFGRAPRHRMSGLLWEKLPFFALTIASCMVTFYTEEKGNTVANLARVPLGLRLANAVGSYATYLRKTVWPDDLAVFYPYTSSISVGAVVTAILLLAAITIGVVAAHRRRPYLAVGWFWFLGTLVPVIGLVAARPNIMADRYTYIPLIGIFVMIAWGVLELVSRWRHPRVTLALAAAAALGACVVGARLQLGYWQNDFKLFSHAVAVTRNNYFIHNILGTVLDQQGKHEAAIGHFKEALRLKPDLAAVRSQFGVALARQGRLAEAIVQFQLALQHEPKLAEAHANLGKAYVTQGQIEAAIRHRREALRLRPDGPEELNSLAWILATSSQAAYRNGNEAAQLAERAVELTKRQDAGKLDTLAAAYAEAGRFMEAVKIARQAMEIATAVGQSDLAGQVRSRLELYQEQRTFRQPPAALAPGAAGESSPDVTNGKHSE